MPQAEAIYRKILQARPDYPDALHLLGLIANQIGNHEAALNLIGKAIAVNSKVADFHNSHGEVYRAMGRLEEAIASYERARQLRPNFVEPSYNQGLALQDQGRLDAAVVCYERALALKPDLSVAHNNLGNIRQQQGQLAEAIRHYGQAIACAPAYAEAYSNLGNVFQALGRMDESVACYRRALAINPGYAGAYHNLGNALRELGKLDESAQCYQQALVHEPNYAEAQNSLGNVLGELGKFGEALAHYREAIVLRPNYSDAYSNLLLTQNYVGDLSTENIFSAHREFSRRYGEPLAGLVKPHTNDRTVGRRLRIGYVSGDFKNHAVAYFIEPVLARHNHEEFEVFCYSSAGVADDVTRRLQSYVDHWRVITQAADEKVAEWIREDGIDLLIDLSGHTRDNRLLVFARKPAPVQVTWLGYPNTTGLATMDYRITDGTADPVGMTEHLYTEHL
ncbi:MAG: O-linked N-acetylglucosamine transferase, SPINDLY family protein, partial [Gammaproteobacteria bacterium]